MTGLPEYRNGGLFIDFGVLKLKSKDQNGDKERLFSVDSQEIVEWRALTICFLVRILQKYFEVKATLWRFTFTEYKRLFN